MQNDDLFLYVMCLVDILVGVLLGSLEYELGCRK